MAGATDLFDGEGNLLKDAEEHPRKGIQIAVFDATSQKFLTYRTVSELSKEYAGSDKHDLFGNFGQVDLAVDALGRAAVAFEWKEPEAELSQTLIRVLSFEHESRQWTNAHPKFLRLRKPWDYWRHPNYFSFGEPHYSGDFGRRQRRNQSTKPSLFRS